MKKIKFSALWILAISLTGAKFALAADSLSQTVQGANDIQNGIVIGLIIFFLVILINAAGYLWANFSLQFSDSPKKIFFFPCAKSKRLGSQIILGAAEVDQKKAPFVKIDLLDEEGDLLASTYSRRDGSFKFHVSPSKYLLSANTFSFISVAQKPIEITAHDKKTLVSLNLKKTENAFINPPARNFLFVNRIIFLALFLLGTGLYFEISKSQNKAIVVAVALCAFISALCAVVLKENFLSLKTVNGPLKNESVEIANAHDATILKTKTNQKGRLKIAMSQGIYKIKFSRHSATTVTIGERGMVDLKLRV